ncbi:MAG: hypothetical protein E7557_02245 [Ruminococcaceae bacterium]|nr:hypothetical protein [Oscillospiraceae bacterium]
MKFLKSEKWKLEEVTRRVCLLVTIFYGFMIFLVGLTYLIAFVADSLPVELYDFFENFIECFISIVYGPVLFANILLYITKIIYVIPVIITMFLISVAFIELVKRKNLRVFVHPLVLSSIATSFAGTLAITHLIENSF